MSAVLVSLGGLLLVLWTYCGYCVNIKLTDPPHTNRYQSSYSSTKILTLRAPPANISGPPHLRLLSNECFKLRDKSYTYSVCPFHNVTQKEDTSAWNNFHGVLGVWREWIIEDDRFAGMHFTLGEPCGSKDREAKIMFNCSTVTLLTNVTEPSTCKYTIWLYTPLACFKGAMQIYHVMDQKSIDKWDLLNLEYHNKELTKKGLLKKRREVLLEAGIYYNFTKDEEYLKKQATATTSYTSAVDYSAPAKTANQNDLDQCYKRVQSFEEQLRNAKQHIDTVLEMIGRKDMQLKAEIELYLASTVNKTTVITSHTGNTTNGSTSTIPAAKPAVQTSNQRNTTSSKVNGTAGNTGTTGTTGTVETGTVSRVNEQPPDTQKQQQSELFEQQRLDHKQQQSDLSEQQLINHGQPSDAQKQEQSDEQQLINHRQPPDTQEQQQPDLSEQQLIDHRQPSDAQKQEQSEQQPIDHPNADAVQGLGKQQQLQEEEEYEMKQYDGDVKLIPAADDDVDQQLQNK